MKSAKDPRHKKRQKTVKALFAESFTQQPNLPTEARKILGKIVDIDNKIKISAPVWPIDKLNKIDLAILRLAVYELVNTKTPPKVIIDEAVELAKEFGSDASPSFVNGVLGTIYKDKKGTKNKKTKREMKKKTIKNKKTSPLDTLALVKQLLAEHIGVEPQDIDDKDAFSEDLHMKSSDLSDFLEVLQGNGVETRNLDLTTIETVNDLIESIGSEELIE